MMVDLGDTQIGVRQPLQLAHRVIRRDRSRTDIVDQAPQRCFIHTAMLACNRPNRTSGPGDISRIFGLDPRIVKG